MKLRFIRNTFTFAYIIITIAVVIEYFTRVERCIQVLHAFVTTDLPSAWVAPTSKKYTLDEHTTVLLPT